MVGRYTIINRFLSFLIASLRCLSPCYAKAYNNIIHCITQIFTHNIIIRNTLRIMYYNIIIIIIWHMCISLLYMHVCDFSCHRIWANLTHHNIWPVESVINNKVGIYAYIIWNIKRTGWRFIIISKMSELPIKVK